MELIVALPQLAGPGGSQTYALTVAEHLARLGHEVTLFAQELGAMAGLARERALRVTADFSELPERADGVLVSLSRSLTLDLAARYPEAARVFVVHEIDDIRLPPPVEGVVAATVALSDRFAARAEACVGAGEVVRMRQPVDMRRFSVRRPPADRPARALLLGNTHNRPGSRAEILKEAWSSAGLEWRHVGWPYMTLDAAQAMYDVDIVVGYGRSIVEAMASGRPAYVLDHAGGDGWVTPESYERIEAAGFSGMGEGPPPGAARLRADLDDYRAELGHLGYDLVRSHHDVRQHAAELVSLIRRLAPEPAPVEPSALRALSLLSEAQLRAEVARDQERAEGREWFARVENLHLELNEANQRLEAVTRSRRYRLADRLVRAARVMKRVR